MKLTSNLLLGLSVRMDGLPTLYLGLISSLLMGLFKVLTIRLLLLSIVCLALPTAEQA